MTTQNNEGVQMNSNSVSDFIVSSNLAPIANPLSDKRNCGCMRLRDVYSAYCEYCKKAVIPSVPVGRFRSLMEERFVVSRGANNSALVYCTYKS